MKYLFSFILILSILSSCRESTHVYDDEETSHDHGAMLITIMNEGMELFAEAGRFYEGHNSEILAHFTVLDVFKPAASGEVSARIVMTGVTGEWTPFEEVEPGIYKGSLKTPDAGLCSLEFFYKAEGNENTFIMDSLRILSHGEEPHGEKEHNEGLTFTREQAWKTEFGLMEIVPSEFIHSIHCSGEVILPPQGVVKIISPASGKVNFIDKDLIEGAFVKEGDPLFTLSGTGLSHENINLEYKRAKLDYEKSLANFERKEKLLRIGAVSQKEYDESKNILEQDRARYELLESLSAEGGLVVRSPVSGFISMLTGSDNNYAETGSLLAELLTDTGVRIKALLPATESGKLSSIKDANMRFAGDPGIYSLEDLGGKKMSFAHQVEAGSGMIPVFFDLSKADIIAGTFVEMWLKTDNYPDGIIVPASSLVEEYGKYFVYVQEEGEVYEKREINLVGTDGINYLVSSGLESGEIIVSKGAMAIKLANAMGAAPVHSH